MEGLLIPEKSRQRLAWQLKTMPRPDEIPVGVWIGLKQAQRGFLEFKTMGVLCDIFGYQNITRALGWPEKDEKNAIIIPPLAG